MDGSPAEKVATIDYKSGTSPRRRAWRVLRMVFLGLAVIGGLLLLADWAYKRYTNVYIDDARITADVISVSSRVSGWVTKLPVGEGDRVKAGQTLVSIDIRDAKLRLSELDSRLRAIGAERSRALTEKTMIDRQTKSAQSVRRSQVRAAKAALAGRRSDLDLARTDFERTKKLLNRKVVSRQRWEETAQRLP